jgi:hypothetical protein
LKPFLAEMVPGWSSICYMIINSFGFKMAAMPVMLSDWMNFLNLFRLHMYDRIIV